MKKVFNEILNAFFLINETLNAFNNSFNNSFETVLKLILERTILPDVCGCVVLRQVRLRDGLHYHC